MKIIDISWPISQTITGYKDRITVRFETRKTIAKDAVLETGIQLDSHEGAHEDVPADFLPDGKTIDAVSLNSLIGMAKVIDCINVHEKITVEFLQTQNIEAGDIILFKTSNSQRAPTEKFDANFIYLDAAAAEYLVEKKIKAVGIDYLGIERNQKEHTTHRALMQHDVTIIEGLRLGHVNAGRYQCISFH